MSGGRREKRSKRPKGTAAIAASYLPQKRKNVSLAPSGAKNKKVRRKSNGNNIGTDKKEEKKGANIVLEAKATASQQLSFVIDHYQSSTGTHFSSLELDALNETCILELSHDLTQDADNLAEHMKAAFGSSWEESLCEKQLQKGKIDPGNPALLVISLSALRSLELLRGLRPFSRKCHAAKLFSKHMKVEDQVSLLKERVNVASGTPSRIKKLIDMEALGLSRLRVVVLDIRPDVKGYSLFTLPQIRDEFWDLFKCYFHQLAVQGNLRLCLYGFL